MKNFKISVLMLSLCIAAATGFTSCKKDVRGDYVGSYRTNYQFTVNGQDYSGTYTLTIVLSATNDNDIILNNIDNSGESVRATVNGNAMNIPQQSIKSIGISGSGTLNGNVLNFFTQETQTGGVTLNVTQTATKQ